MSRKTLATALLVAAVAAGISVGCGARQAPDAASSLDPVETVATPAGHAVAAPPPVEVLRAWDERRADAWARGDLEKLAALYTRGSGAGRRDRAMLHAWTSRGLVVRGLRTQLLRVRELDRSRSTWTLEVTDRLAGGVAVGPGLRRPLPVDAATTRTVLLQRVEGRWLVASVT